MGVWGGMVEIRGEGDEGGGEGRRCEGDGGGRGGVVSVRGEEGKEHVGVKGEIWRVCGGKRKD